MGLSIKYVRKIFRKTNISNPLIRIYMWAYLWVRNDSFSETFAYVLNGWPLSKFFTMLFFAKYLIDNLRNALHLLGNGENFSHKSI